MTSFMLQMARKKQVQHRLFPDADSRLGPKRLDKFFPGFQIRPANQINAVRHKG